METTQTPAALSTDDPRHRFGRGVAIATQVIGAIRPDQLDLPTPCPEYDVRGLLGHMVGAMRRVVAMGEGRNPLSVVPMVDGVPDDGWPQAWAEVAHACQAAFTDDAALEQEVVLPWRTGTAAEQLLGYLNEVTVHTWDLAQATGQDPEWDPEVLETAWAAIHTSLPVAERADLFEAITANLPAGVPAPPRAFADAVPVPDDAPMIERLVAWNGRQP